MPLRPNRISNASENCTAPCARAAPPDPLRPQCHRAAGSVQLVRVCQTLGAAADPAAQLRGSRPSSVEDAEHDRRSGSTQCRWCPMCTSDEPRTRVEVTARLAQSRTRAAMQGPPGSSLRLSQYVFETRFDVSKECVKGCKAPPRWTQLLPPRRSPPSDCQAVAM